MTSAWSIQHFPPWFLPHTPYHSDSSVLVTLTTWGPPLLALMCVTSSLWLVLSTFFSSTASCTLQNHFFSPEVLSWSHCFSPEFKPLFLLSWCSLALCCQEQCHVGIVWGKLINVRERVPFPVGIGDPQCTWTLMPSSSLRHEWICE